MRKSPLLIIVGVVILLDVVLIIFGSWFLQSEIITRAERMRTERSQIVTDDRLQPAIASMRANLKAHEQDFTTLQSVLLESSNEALVAYIESLGELARTQKVTLNISGAALTGGEAPFNARLMVSVNGTYAGVMNFFALLEHSPVYVFMDGTHIQGSGKDVNANTTLYILQQNEHQVSNTNKTTQDTSFF